jgi:CubicO group peptidase (beta-lactamase class C family)
MTPFRFLASVNQLAHFGMLMFAPDSSTNLPGRTAQSDTPWPRARLETVGLDSAAIASFDADLASGKYPYVDSMLIIRCGKRVYERVYSHDYGTIYYKEARTKGPLNAGLSGIYNYFDSQIHPYYQDTNLHTMQSVTKTITSVITGVAMHRNEFRVEMDAPILQFFDISTIKNLDDRKRRVTLRDLLTMRSGLDWDEDVPYYDPRNGCCAMEACDDWVQFVIDRPMIHEPGTHFAYSSGVSELLGYIFQKATGQDIEAYAAEHLFKPLRIEHHYWKRTPLGLVDTEGGLFLRPQDLAKIGDVYLHDGMWMGHRIVSSDWVKQSITPSTNARQGMKYGYQWWLIPYGTAPERLAWAALGLGGQRLLVLPELDLILVFTGWNILAESSLNSREAIDRITAGISHRVA